MDSYFPKLQLTFPSSYIPKLLLHSSDLFLSRFVQSLEILHSASTRARYVSWLEREKSIL